MIINDSKMPECRPRPLAISRLLALRAQVLGTSSKNRSAGRRKVCVVSLGQSIAYICLASVILLGIFLRFYKLDERGLAGSDAVYYTSIAKTWSEGEITYKLPGGPFVYRPAVFAIFATGIKIFGYHDYAIKITNACVDSLNILLIFAITYLMARKCLWAAFSTGITYALLPMGIHMSRIELTHTISSLMVLSSLLCFFLSYQPIDPWQSRFYMALSGVFTGLAALTHEELLFIGFGYLIFIIATRPPKLKGWAHLESLIMQSLVFTGGLLAVCHKLLNIHSIYAIRGTRRARKILSNEELGLPTKAYDHLEEAARFLWNSILANTSSIALYAFLICLLLAAVEAGVQLKRTQFRETQATPLHYLPFVILFSYFLFYSHFFDDYLVRIFFPLVPLVIISTASWCSHWLRRSNLAAAPAITLLLTALLIIFNLDNYTNHTRLFSLKSSKDWTSAKMSTTLDLYASYRSLILNNYSKSWSRRVYENMKSKVSSDAKMLVTSSIFFPFPGRRLLQMEYYFGDNAIYIIDHEEPLAELISKHSIQYVMFTSHRARPEFLRKKHFDRYEYQGQWKTGERLFLGAGYGFEPAQYTLIQEYQYLATILTKRDARVIHLDGKPVGQIKGPPKRIPRTIIYEL